MLLIPKKKEEQGSAFTEAQAKSIEYNVEDINSNLYGFFGTLNKRDKKKFLKSKVQHMQLMEQLNKGSDQDNNPKKKEADKKWFKIVGIMAKGIGGLFKGVANIAKSLASNATGLIGLLLGLYIILKLGLLKTLVPAALGMLKTLVTGIIEVLPDIIKWAWEILKEWVPKLVNAFADAISDALGLSKESKLRKVMPYLVGIGSALFGLYKVVSMFGLGGAVFKGLLGGIGKLAGALGPQGALLTAVVGFTAYAISGYLDALQELRNTSSANLAQIEKDQKELAIFRNKTQKEDIKRYGKEYVEKRNAQEKASQEYMKSINEEMQDIGEWGVLSPYYWKNLFTDLGDKSKKEILDQANKDMIAENQKLARKKYEQIKKEQNGYFTKHQRNAFKQFIAADEAKAKIEKKKRAITAESQKKYFNVWEKQDKTRQKKQIASLKESQKANTSYWERIKETARSVLSSRPQPQPQPQETRVANQSMISRMEDFFKPFSKRMSEIFGNIGDTFGAMIDHIKWGLSNIPGFGINKHGADIYEQYRTREIIEKIKQDPEAKARVEEYSRAKASGNQARIEAASRGMTTNEKELGDLLVKGNDTIGKYAESLDRFINQELRTKSGSQTAVLKFFPELSNNTRDLSKVSAVYGNR